MTGGAAKAGPTHMPARKYAYWDYQARRHDARIATLLDALAARTEGYAGFDALGDDERKRLAFEYRRRTEYWMEQAQHSRFWMLCMIGLSALIVLIAAAGFVIAGFDAILAVALGTAGLVLVMIGGHSLLHVWALGLALHRRHCPDCRYDLSGHEPAINPESLGNAFIGPQTCPECGAPWPLLPGPVPPHG